MRAIRREEAVGWTAKGLTTPEPLAPLQTPSLRVSSSGLWVGRHASGLGQALGSSLLAAFSDVSGGVTAGKPLNLLCTLAPPASPVFPPS